MESVTHSAELNPHNCCSSRTHVCNFIHEALSTIGTRIPTDSGCYQSITLKSASSQINLGQYQSQPVLLCSAFWVRVRSLSTRDVILLSHLQSNAINISIEKQKKTS